MIKQQLRKQLATAEQNISKAISRYRRLIDSIWVETASGRLEPATPKCFSWQRGGWHFREYITEAYDKFYRPERGEKRLAECWGQFELRNVRPVAYDAVKRLEDKLESAFIKRESLLILAGTYDCGTWGDLTGDYSYLDEN